MLVVFVCIFVTAVGFFINDQYIQRDFVPPPEVAREPIPPQTMTPRPEREVLAHSVPIEIPHRENEDEAEPLPPERELLPRVIQLREYFDNPDVVGYLYVPDTNISYPIVQTGNNEFYLYHDIRKQACRGGAMFMDYENNIHDLLDDSTLIFGHNNRDGSKLHDLRYFHREQYFRDRRYIMLTTPYEETVWEVFSFFPTTTQERDYMITNFPSKDEFYDFLLYMQSRSLHTTDVVLTTDCQIIILSTCAVNNRARINRYILLGRLVR